MPDLNDDFTGADPENVLLTGENDFWSYRTLQEKIAKSRPTPGGSIIWFEPHGTTLGSALDKHVMRVEDALATVAAVDRTLRRLTPQERRLVQMRYVQQLAWQTVAWRLHISERTALRMRNKILSTYWAVRHQG